VSTKNISGPCGVVLSLEVGIQPYIRHRSQQFGQIAAGWSHQGRRQDGPMLGFGTAAMGACPLLERLHDPIIKTTHQQVCHQTSTSPDSNASWGTGRSSGRCGVDDADLHLANATLGAIQAGIELTRDQDAAKAAEIERWLDQVCDTFIILTMDGPAFRRWAQLMTGVVDQSGELMG
jgi:hypothetical protein